MSIDCRVTIKGNGLKGDRNAKRPSSDRTGTVEDFLTLHMSGVYQDIFKHVKSCGKCSPAEVIQGYIKGREGKNLGIVSTGLSDLFKKYERHFPGCYPEALKRESQWRSRWIHEFIYATENSSPEEVIRALRFRMSLWKAGAIDPKNDSPWAHSDKWAYGPIFGDLIQLHLSGIQIPPNWDEITKLATIVYVMNT